MHPVICRRSRGILLSNVSSAVSFFVGRSFSQSTSIPKKLQRVRDHGFDNYMEIHKKIIKVLKFQDLILSQPNQYIAVSRLDTLARRFGFKQYESGAFVLKFPHIFQIYEHPVQRILYCRLSPDALRQIADENAALDAQIPDATARLRKLLMLSNSGRLRLEHIRVARKDFGLPEDFEYSVVLQNPQFFRLFDADGPARSKYVELVHRDSELAVCSIELLREKEYREKGKDAEDIRFSFIVNFPPGFKIGKYYKIAVWKWQRLPYWSPYEDVSNYDLRSLEAKKRMEKRAVAMIHEMLSLTVEKKMTLERIAHFRMAMDLPKKLKEFLLQHQGIFYISTRGNHGKLHTVFLREAYWKGALVQPNRLYLARRRLGELIMTSPRKAKLDEDLVHFRRTAEDEECLQNLRRELVEEDQWGGGGDHGGDSAESELDTGIGSDFSDESTEHKGTDHEGTNDEAIGVSE